MGGGVSAGAGLGGTGTGSGGDARTCAEAPAAQRQQSSASRQHLEEENFDIVLMGLVTNLGACFGEMTVAIAKRVGKRRASIRSQDAASEKGSRLVG
jgi:hypothetical protein